ncbi:MAG TPA: hypothetical protein VIS27_07070 [Yeosuana sp.]
MKIREAAIVSAYTGILIGNFEDMHEYIEEILKRPVFIHELVDSDLVAKIKEKAKSDFISIQVS